MLTARRFVYFLALFAALVTQAGIGVIRLRLKGAGAEIQTFLAKTLVRYVERMGPAATKLAQIASARTDILPERFCTALSTVQDNVRTPPKGVLREIKVGLSRKLGMDIEDVPIAAGSIAFVLKARTHEGKSLALKVVRPGVRRALEVDLALMRCLFMPAARLLGIAHVALIETFDELSETILVQTDMLVELRHTQFARRLLADQPIKIPEPFADCSDRDVLVLEYCPAAYKILNRALPRSAYETASLAIAKATFSMIFIHGFIHCDLHPGNVGVSGSGEPIVYDFGLTGTMSDRERRHFRDFFLAMAMSDSAGAAASILASAKEPPGPDFDPSTFERDLGCLMVSASRVSTGKFVFLRLVEAILDLQRRHRVVVSSAFVKAVWALVTLDGLLRSRFSNEEFQKMAVLVIRQSHAKDNACG